MTPDVLLSDITAPPSMKVSRIGPPALVTA
jgi:hypothetical protein